jgi:NAD(P)-dependent dehydrogenase (short-subunit alcohol dehydrogenase family)
MARQIKDSVVVITGASSGIGRAAALLFAEQGANVVVAARNEHALNEVCEACENLGGRAICCPCDVSKEEDVQRLARKAIEEFGRIDTWVNNAAVTLFGRFEEVPPEAWRKVIETNLFGYVYGARAVLPHFRERGEGVIINISSVVGKAGIPYLSAYATSKFAIRGFAEALRMELRNTNLKVCTIFPASIDTPLFQHAGNFSGQGVKPMPPVYRAEEVAAAILACARRPRPEMTVGLAGHAMKMQHAVSKRIYDRLMGRQAEKEHFQDRPAPHSEGNLYQPMEDWTSVSGNWTSGAPRDGGMNWGVVLALLVPAALIGYLISDMMRPRHRSMVERLTPGSSTRRTARRWAERAGLRQRTFGEKISDQIAGLGAALLATGVMKRLRKGDVRGAGRELRKQGEHLGHEASRRYQQSARYLADAQKRGGRMVSSLRDSDMARRASRVGHTVGASRPARAASNLSRQARREYQRRYRPGPIQRMRRALGM